MLERSDEREVRLRNCKCRWHLKGSTDDTNENVALKLLNYFKNIKIIICQWNVLALNLRELKKLILL